MVSWFFLWGWSSIRDPRSASKLLLEECRQLVSAPSHSAGSLPHIVCFCLRHGGLGVPGRCSFFLSSFGYLWFVVVVVPLMSHGLPSVDLCDGRGFWTSFLFRVHRGRFPTSLLLRVRSQFLPSIRSWRPPEVYHGTWFPCSSPGLRPPGTPSVSVTLWSQVTWSFVSYQLESPPDLTPLGPPSPTSEPDPVSQPEPHTTVLRSSLLVWVCHSVSVLLETRRPGIELLQDSTTYHHQSGTQGSVFYLAVRTFSWLNTVHDVRGAPVKPAVYGRGGQV